MSEPFDLSKFQIVASGVPEQQAQINNQRVLALVAQPLLWILRVLFDFELLGYGKTWRTDVTTPSQRITVTIEVAPQ